MPNTITTVHLGPAVLAGSIIANLGVSTALINDMSSWLSTALAATLIIAFGTAIIAMAFWFFRLARLVQFLPYPVICGFIAGVG
ncbi:MAG: SulP family inorganic anion transporter [Candidatus Competibacterales bacterium]